MQNPLTVLPARIRAYVYAALVLAAIVYGAWQAADGDWKTAVGSIITALVGGQALANTSDSVAPENTDDGEG